MVKTHGLTHINLRVRDVDRALRFYREVFGVEVLWHEPDMVQVQTPGTSDLIALVPHPDGAGTASGVTHFGFRLVDPKDIAAAVKAVESAGGRVLRTGEHAPGMPYAYVNDPDGYEIEIFYE